MTKPSKILVSGTGRCGTTFLMILFTYLGLDTGWTRDTFQKAIFENCNSGMEKNYTAPNYIIKSPGFIQRINEIVKHITVKYMIIPVRDYRKSAHSRAENGNKAGGLWCAKNEEEQLQFYNKIMTDYMLAMAKHDIPTLVLDFDRMVSDELYLFAQLYHVFPNITREEFHTAYMLADEHQKKRSRQAGKP